MAQTGFTPISNYYSATATNVPTAGNLVAGELAINTADGKLFYKDSSGVVQTIATKATAALPTTTTGSGAIVLQTSPTITTPSITTPTISSGGANFSGSTSGTINLVATATAGTNTITLPASTGTVALTSQIPAVGPSFSVSGNNSTSQSVSANTTAKITFYTTAGSDYYWDTASCWNSANNRFIPNVAGYYTFSTNLGTAGWSSGNQFNLIIRKNGSVSRWAIGTTSSSSNDIYMNGSCTFSMNGTTDYVEVYLFNNGGNTITVRNESERTWFTGTLARAA
jgi:hypothetical protein